MALPTLTPEQRKAALEVAKVARTARKEMMIALKSGQITLADVFKKAEDDLVTQKTKVSAVLKALPGIGEVRAGELMKKIDIAPSRRIRGLGDRQRRELIEAVG
ncbi:integration host factor, actinobacterial type [Amycolatopsis saalfeldensis]|uniref:Integration host factor-like helix-two turn-helix domain-containing protein n=1 Tax=Amycolatopsis saalfeldensis TaxID=394193 RepID=A0A1H8YPQ8_9PSEU|nr:integration host factor, actinobacterial type [Amycolatopsis saalfeldensis]SEP53971.1 hypothetical protein SAMN04489732_13426 [Amycolatopsis saalfeldensis]